MSWEFEVIRADTCVVKKIKSRKSRDLRSGVNASLPVSACCTRLLHVSTLIMQKICCLCELVCAENLLLCSACVKGKLRVNSAANSPDFTWKRLNSIYCSPNYTYSSVLLNVPWHRLPFCNVLLYRQKYIYVKKSLCFVTKETVGKIEIIKISMDYYICRGDLQPPQHCLLSRGATCMNCTETLVDCLTIWKGMLKLFYHCNHKKVIITSWIWKKTDTEEGGGGYAVFKDKE